MIQLHKTPSEQPDGSENSFVNMDCSQQWKDQKRDGSVVVEIGRDGWRDTKAVGLGSFP